MPQDSSAHPVQEGDVIAGKYRVERVLGAGGMGIVVAAMHLELEQRVALKFLLPEAAAHATVVARFAREARAAAKIRCEHVARVIDVGSLESGAPFMVMEYMEGQDLEQLLRQHGPLPTALAVDYVLQASEAIAEAHALGLVHRDVKPANLFLASQPSKDPIIKVLDFGISKQLPSAEQQQQLTKTSSVIGSPLYMSPEQMTSAKNVDERADLWALGVVLFELLAGKTPFAGDTMPDCVAAILQVPEASLRSYRPDVPPELEAAIRRCLEKDVTRRFQNVAELAMAIAPFGPPHAETAVQRIARVLRLTDPSRRAPTAQSGTDPRGPTTGDASGRAIVTGPATGPSHAGMALAVGGDPPRRAAGVGVALVDVARGGGVRLGPRPLGHRHRVMGGRTHEGDRRDARCRERGVRVGCRGDRSRRRCRRGGSSEHCGPALDRGRHGDAPLAPPTSPPRVAPPTVHPTPPKPPAAPTCRTVSYFDDDGNRRFRRECK